MYKLTSNTNSAFVIVIYSVIIIINRLHSKRVNSTEAELRPTTFDRTDKLARAVASVRGQSSNFLDRMVQAKLLNSTSKPDEEIQTERDTLAINVAIQRSCKIEAFGLIKRISNPAARLSKFHLHKRRVRFRGDRNSVTGSPSRATVRCKHQG